MATTVGTMTRDELIRAIRGARRVLAWARLTEHDGAYVALGKTEAIRIVRDFEDGGDRAVFVASLEDGVVHLN